MTVTIPDAPGSIIVEQIIDKELFGDAFERNIGARISDKLDRTRIPNNNTKALFKYTEGKLTALGYKEIHSGQDGEEDKVDLIVTFILKDHENVIREMEEFYGMKAVPIE
ncbi:hypothetical protein KC717_00605 [Candidatus Dojkabacteria bacterium]|uniref:Uncharacterized protein n=1 Tax=Candidatus Dojkabacteria bacterium TaxID=2099670 RepID=A0A955L7F1_9BACT|nr:hypothetical protein [Candidatus Dojkabacteria bacterium]